jgi:hypothetical protein
MILTPRIYTRFVIHMSAFQQNQRLSLLVFAKANTTAMAFILVRFEIFTLLNDRIIYFILERIPDCFNTSITHATRFLRTVIIGPTISPHLNDMSLLLLGFASTYYSVQRKVQGNQSKHDGIVLYHQVKSSHVLEQKKEFGMRRAEPRNCYHIAYCNEE